jgi:hypothetical protein
MKYQWLINGVMAIINNNGENNINVVMASIMSIISWLINNVANAKCQ